ncbi:putative central bZIP transcription factor domain-containing protein [Cryptosporidium canis]|uniref:Central bZIP transcription factor domain-containing protein n=1 Tax=Cryptosporidium canis TaxID=195482 RepID=A0A9D5DF89_9CRYT|nr:putative central bZIP transcription factor domain-containing protein [Cryptosporidium canis]
MSNQDMTPKKHNYMEEGTCQMMNFDGELNRKLMSSPYTSDESSIPGQQHSDHLIPPHNLRQRSSYRASISTNNTLSSPRSSEVLTEMIYSSANNGMDMGMDKESYIIVDNDGENMVSSGAKSSISQKIDDMVMQRLSSSKRKRMRRIPSSSRSISSKMEMDLNPKGLIGISGNESNTRSYNLSTFKYTSMIDTNSEEFNSMPHSMQKKILQMIRNRQSAQKHRDKQKIERQNLIQENISLRARIVELTNELQELRAKQLAIFEQEGMLSQIKNGYRFTNYHPMNAPLGNINGSILAGKRVENVTSNHRNLLGVEDSEISHHNMICNDNLHHEKSKSKIDNIGLKNQEMDCGFGYAPVDDYSNTGMWNSVCDSAHGNANISTNHHPPPPNSNNGIVRNTNLCNQLTIHPNIDVLPWIGGVSVGGVVAWNKQNNYVEDMMITNK